MITDEMLAQAAAELADAINESLPSPSECTHQFSPQFEKKMKRLIRRANHPTVYRALRSVVSILLVIMIGFGSTLAVSAEAREIVFGWVKQQYENFYEYFFEGEVEPTESEKYQPGWMPEDCEFLTIQETAGGETYIYKDQSGLLAQFYYIYDPDSQKMYIDTVEYISESVSINGHSGELYLSVNEGETSSIVWTDSTNNVLFYFSGAFDKETLIKMAENVTQKNN